MPKSHDSKPRKKHRRQKAQQVSKPRSKSSKSVISLRSYHRRQLRQNALDVTKAQKDLEIALRQLGVSWRKVEKAIHKAGGAWSKLDSQFIAKLCADSGVVIEVPLGKVA